MKEFVKVQDITKTYKMGEVGFMQWITSAFRLSRENLL